MPPTQLGSLAFVLRDGSTDVLMPMQVVIQMAVDLTGGAGHIAVRHVCPRPQPRAAACTRPRVCRRRGARLSEYMRRRTI